MFCLFFKTSSVLHIWGHTFCRGARGPRGWFVYTKKFIIPGVWGFYEGTYVNVSRRLRNLDNSFIITGNSSIITIYVLRTVRTLCETGRCT